MSGWAGFSDAELRKLKDQKDNKSAKGFLIHLISKFKLRFSYMLLRIFSRDDVIFFWGGGGGGYFLLNANDPNYSLNSTVSSGQDPNEASPGKRVPNILSASRSRTQREAANPVSSPGALVISSKYLYHKHQ